jgi:hypothetical protein
VGEADGAENRAGQDGRPPVAVVGNKQRAGYCPSQANFGDASDRRKRFCARHRRHTDVDLRKVPRLAAQPRRGDGLGAMRVTADKQTFPCADASPGADGSYGGIGGGRADQAGNVGEVVGAVSVVQVICVTACCSAAAAG